MMNVLIHGFWGAPADWSEVIGRLPLGLEVWAPDLYEPGPLGPHHELTHWTDHFIEEIEDRAHGRPVQAVGYSMGARLLLTALLQRPELFHCALLLSGRPFPLEEAEREARRSWENEWRARFLSEPWDALERPWNEQSVFAGSRNEPRRRGSILREMLGQSLINWSPTRHFHRAEDLKSLNNSVDWAFGALDQNYRGFAKDLAKLGVRGQITFIEKAGHRLPLDASRWIAEWIQGSNHE